MEHQNKKKNPVTVFWWKIRQFKKKNPPKFKNDLKWPTFITTIKS